MCYNKETSLTSFVMSWAIAFYLLKRNIKYDRWYAFFLIIFSTNQLFDFLLWSDFSITRFQSISQLNKLVSYYLLPIFLSSQFITQLLGKYYYQTKNIDNAVNKLFKPTLTNLVYIVFTLVFFYTYFTNTKTTVLSDKGHLLWGGINKNNQNLIIPFLFLIFIMYPYIEYFNTSLSIRLMVIFATISLSWSLFCTDSWGSLWCWIGNFSSIIMLFSPYLD